MDATTNTIQILLVDDLHANLLALEGLLKRADVEIFTTKSGTEALELMITHDFAVALIDVQMPGMSGFELAELMRGTKKTKNIPIIFVTATTQDQGTSFKGYESGAVDFLLKPLDTHAVKSKVNIFIELYQQKKDLANQLETITTLAEDLHRAKLEMEVRVQDRTAELLQSTQDLQAEILERKRVEKEILEVTENEQKRFGSQLHDGLCQDLTGILLLLEGLTQKMAKEKYHGAPEIEKVSVLLKAAVSQARDTARGFYLGELDGNSLTNLFEELVTSQNRQGISCRLDCPEPILISDNAIATHFYKIAQEGVANAVKHGKAKHIEVGFMQNQSDIVLTIKDDGVGFATPTPNSKGIGLKVMKNRCHIIGATFAIIANEPHGVILTCTLKKE